VDGDARERRHGQLTRTRARLACEASESYASLDLSSKPYNDSDSSSRMGSTEEPERKRRHNNSISPMLKKQPLLPSSEEKKVNITYSFLSLFIFCGGLLEGSNPGILSSHNGISSGVQNQVS